jgi:hypothetical protein
MVYLCWENQNEENRREEGKKGKFNTHGAGKSPKESALKRRRKGSMCALS